MRVGRVNGYITRPFVLDDFPVILEPLYFGIEVQMLLINSYDFSQLEYSLL
jgi:hypothetical protein